MNYKKIFYLLLNSGLGMIPFLSFAQVSRQHTDTENKSKEDTIQLVEILPGNKSLELRRVDDSTTLQILSGNVRLRQGNTLFFSDSCVINNRTRIFEAFGHVHIIDSDTSHAWSDYLQYLSDKKIAYLKGNVKLSSGTGVLTTPDLEYDVDTKIGIYTHGGKVVNKNKTVLTSKEGYYYTDLKDVYFKKDVVLDDPAYHLKTDSLIYNTENETARFIAYTFIKDSTGRTIETTEGFYDLKSGLATFGNHPKIRDGKLFVTGEQVNNNDSTGIININGKGAMIDTAEGRSVFGEEIIINKKTNTFLATKKPLMIIRQENDSVYITGDTLFSARLSDLNVKKDSLEKDTIQGIKLVNLKAGNDKDSTNRYFQAFHNVRIFSDSLQAVCDSMFYSFQDSVFRLFTDPVIWAKESQITGDTILLYTKNKKADHLRVFDNSFLVNEVQPEVFNQIKSSRMDGYFKEGTLDSVRAKGFVECIYYIQDEDSAFTGINQSQSDALDIYFSGQQIQKVVFRSAVTGTIWPMKQKDPKEMRLPKFKWLEDRRPKSKEDLLEEK
ncbi:MAG: OstA family protein [Bacteroidetes bacterium]|nr:OstA family protein [Bacteroidota bacterium]MBS1930343.1 OstA family protein [Bacteroidota bacterium]